ncbi:MAG: methyltransferase domain-containing protein [Gemmatimonadetes bacterium]|nr:methyltransferase domain-containing protein [Gemmatimonadota bacterium]
MSRNRSRPSDCRWRARPHEVPARVHGRACGGDSGTRDSRDLAPQHESPHPRPRAPLLRRSRACSPTWGPARASSPGGGRLCAGTAWRASGGTPRGVRRHARLFAIRTSLATSRCRGSAPVSDNHFDVVCGVEVVEHVQDQFRFCREIVRVLKPGGTAIVNTQTS